MYVCKTFYSVKTFKKMVELEMAVRGCEKDRLPLITCFCLFALVTICTGGPAVQRFSVFLSNLRFSFTTFCYTALVD